MQRIWQKKSPGSVWFPTFEEMADYTMARAQPGDLILTLGGGDVYKCANLIVKKYQEKTVTVINYALYFRRLYGCENTGRFPVRENRNTSKKGYLLYSVACIRLFL